MIIKLQEFPKFDIKLVVREDEKHLWKYFHPYHYMTANSPIDKSFPNSAKMFTFYWVRENIEILVGCLGVMFQIASYPAKRLTRVVVLPEFQGLGISSKMINSIADYYTSKGFKVYGATYHPRLGEFRQKSPNWEKGHYNLREFKLSEDHTDKSMLGLRDGESMYRHYYVRDSKYSLNYDILEYDRINKECSVMEENLTPENYEVYKELKTLQKKFNDMFGIKTITKTMEKCLTDEENQKYKMLRKPKRVPMTAEERKRIKQERKR